jgi:aspartate/methionine/tyrosine aminotransferase
MPWAGPSTLTEPVSTALSPGSSRSGRAVSVHPPTLPSPSLQVPVSATLAANEVMARRRESGEQVLPLAFGESGLPVHPRLIAELASTANLGAYGTVAGSEELRAAAAGYWSRRSLATSPGFVVAGPGSKALLFAALLALGADVAVPRPSWVSYAAQARLLGVTPVFIPVAPGDGGGCCDAAELDVAATAARKAGRPIGAVLVTLPDNPTGRLASPDAIRELCAVAERQDMIIISDEIYRDLIHNPAAPFPSPALIAPERTIVTTGLSKNLSVGGWRIGVARMPDGKAGAALRDRLLGIASEIWSTACTPMQHAAAVAFSEPTEIADRIASSRALHAVVCQEAARVCIAAGLDLAPPQAAFYLYPDFAPWRRHLSSKFGVVTGADLASLLLNRYGAGTLPASAFGEEPSALRLRLATGLLYGDTDEQREASLASRDPLALPWISAALHRFAEILDDLQS